MRAITAFLIAGLVAIPGASQAQLANGSYAITTSAGTCQGGNPPCALDGGFGFYNGTPSVDTYTWATGNATYQTWNWNGSTFQNNGLVANRGGAAGPWLVDDNGGHPGDGATADNWTLTPSGTGGGCTVKDNRTGRFVGSVSGHAAMGTTQTVWTFLNVSGSAVACQGAPPPSAVPTNINYSPASPSLVDNSSSGTPVASFTVTTNPASTYNGTNALTGDALCAAPASGNGSITTSRALASSDDGSHTCTLATTENGTTISKALTFTITAAPPPGVSFPMGLSWQQVTPTPGLIVLRTDRAMTIKSIFGDVTVPETSGAIVDVKKGSCSGTQLNSTSFNAAAAAGADQNLGVASPALAAGDMVVLCSSGFPVPTSSSGPFPVGTASITVMVQ